MISDMWLFWNVDSTTPKMYVPCIFLAGRKETCSPADQDDPSRQHLNLVAELKTMINKQPVEKVYVQVHHHSLVCLNTNWSYYILL